MKYFKIFIAILALVVISSCAKDVVDLTCTIEGVVKDQTTGLPLSNCEVILTPTNRTITTAGDGAYSFTGLEQGEYTLTYNRSGYISDTRTISVKSGEVFPVEMLLKAKASFSLSESIYDFGDLESSMTFMCFNNSASDCSYTLSNLPAWILANKNQGSVKAGSNDTFTLTIDRSKVGIGEYNHNITITYSGHINGTTTLLVKMKKVEYTTPSVTTATSASVLSENSMNIEGTITATGGSQIIAYGHCWSTTENPTINDQCTNLGMTVKIGAFTSTIENLLTNTTYYVRAYATNSQGTAYGEQTIVKTLTTGSDIWNGQIATSFAGGSGSDVDPYIVRTGGQLLLMKSYSDKCFRLENDINLNDNNWLPFEFSGHLEGNGHTIYNLKVARNTDYQGLFSQLSGIVENLKINGVDIQAGSNSYVGGLAGFADNATIKNCEVYFDKQMLGNNYVGGLVGYIEDGTFNINNCRINSNETGCIKGNEYIGGLVGCLGKDYRASTGDVSDNHVNINIEGSTRIGGCFGGAYTVDIIQCSYKGNIKGNSGIGGIVAVYSNSKIIACKSEVNITASKSEGTLGVGGIGGRSGDYTFKVIASYSTGSISAFGKQGAIVPGSTSDVYHCYSTIQIDEAYRYSYSESTSIYDTDNIAQTMFEYYSDYSKYWNYNNTWTWHGNVNGTQVSIPCPKLAWE